MASGGARFQERIPLVGQVLDRGIPVYLPHLREAGLPVKLVVSEVYFQRNGMDHREALAKANQILNEERLNPTVNYIAKREGDSDLSAILSPLELRTLRSQHPREVQEGRRKWAFESTNYNLLRALLAQ